MNTAWKAEALRRLQHLPFEPGVFQMLGLLFLVFAWVFRNFNTFWSFWWIPLAILAFSPVFDLARGHLAAGAKRSLAVLAGLAVVGWVPIASCTLGPLTGVVLGDAAPATSVTLPLAGIAGRGFTWNEGWFLSQQTVACGLAEGALSAIWLAAFVVGSAWRPAPRRQAHKAPEASRS